jgi:hypothetical protein
MGEQQVLDFNTWAREYRGMRGRLANTAENRRLMLDLQRGYGDYRKQFEPATVQQATLPDGSVAAVVNGQVVRDARPKFETFVDDKGFMSRLNLDTGLVERTTNAAGQPVKGSGKKAEVTMMDVMQMSPEQKKTYYDRLARGEDPAAGMPSPTPTPDPGMTNSMAFQGVPARAAYETNMPTGVAAPTMSPDAMGGGGGISMTPVARATAVGPTNAPAPASASGFASAEEVLAAAARGQLPVDAAKQILIQQFGYTP